MDVNFPEFQHTVSDATCVGVCMNVRDKEGETEIERDKKRGPDKGDKACSTYCTNTPCCESCQW